MGIIYAMIYVISWMICVGVWYFWKYPSNENYVKVASNGNIQILQYGLIVSSFIPIVNTIIAAMIIFRMEIDD